MALLHSKAFDNRVESGCYTPDFTLGVSCLSRVIPRVNGRGTERPILACRWQYAPHLETTIAYRDLRQTLKKSSNPEGAWLLRLPGFETDFAADYRETRQTSPGFGTDFTGKRDRLWLDSPGFETDFGALSP